MFLRDLLIKRIEHGTQRLPWLEVARGMRALDFFDWFGYGNLLILRTKALWGRLVRFHKPPIRVIAIKDDVGSSSIKAKKIVRVVSIHVDGVARWCVVCVVESKSSAQEGDNIVCERQAVNALVQTRTTTW
jgi:hypothetical protein